MAGYRYSLAQVRVSITRGKNEIASFGGQGSMIGSISGERSEERFTVAGDATGGFIVNETLNMTGEIVISIRQFAELAQTLTELFNKYDLNEFDSNSENAGAVIISVTRNSKPTMIAKGCFLNMPELAFEEEAQDRDFTFVAGEIIFENEFNQNKII